MYIILSEMKVVLSHEEKLELEAIHSEEKDRRKADRVKTILLRSEGWSLGNISQALRVHSDTVSRYITDYLTNHSLEFHFKGSKESLTEKQTDELIAHLEANLYTKVIEIINYVKSTFNILLANDFAYKLYSKKFF